MDVKDAWWVPLTPFLLPIWNKIVERFDKRIGDKPIPKFPKPAVWVAVVCSLFALGVTASWYAYKHFHKAPALAASTPAPAPPTPSLPAPSAQASVQPKKEAPQPPLRKPRPKAPAQTGQAAPPATTVGSESTVYGSIPQGSRVGDRSVYVGATDAHGNTKVGGGSAIGYGASADPTSVAIGANAHAGGPSTLNSAPNGFAVSGGKLDHPTINNSYSALASEGPNAAQLAASARDLAQRFRSHQTDIDERYRHEVQSHIQIAHDGISPNFFEAMAGFSRPLRPEALQLRSEILPKLPTQADDEECRIFLENGWVFPGKPLNGCGKYFDRLADLLMLK